MNTEEFTYWLQGALEMSPEMLKNGMRPEQVQTIQDHLDLVFDKVTPDRFDKDEVIKGITLEDMRIAHSGPSTGSSCFAEWFILKKTCEKAEEKKSWL